MTIQRGPEFGNVCVFDTADYCTAKEEMKSAVHCTDQKFHSLSDTSSAEQLV